jgi:hypothetical protein
MPTRLAEAADPCDALAQVLEPPPADGVSPDVLDSGLGVPSLPVDRSCGAPAGSGCGNPEAVHADHSMP